MSVTDNIDWASLYQDYVVALDPDVAPLSRNDWQRIHGESIAREQTQDEIRARKEEDCKRAWSSNERTNLDHALVGRDMAALAATGTAYLAFEDYEMGLTDALAELMHFARRYEIDFDHYLETARMHHGEEQKYGWDEVPG